MLKEGCRGRKGKGELYVPRDVAIKNRPRQPEGIGPVKLQYKIHTAAGKGKFHFPKGCR